MGCQSSKSQKNKASAKQTDQEKQQQQQQNQDGDKIIKNHDINNKVKGSIIIQQRKNDSESYIEEKQDQNQIQKQNINNEQNNNNNDQDNFSKNNQQQQQRQRYSNQSSAKLRRQNMESSEQRKQKMSYRQKMKLQLNNSKGTIRNSNGPFCDKKQQQSRNFFEDYDEVEYQMDYFTDRKYSDLNKNNGIRGKNTSQGIPKFETANKFQENIINQNEFSERVSPYSPATSTNNTNIYNHNIALNNNNHQQNNQKQSQRMQNSIFDRLEKRINAGTPSNQNNLSTQS